MYQEFEILLLQQCQQQQQQQQQQKLLYSPILLLVWLMVNLDLMIQISKNFLLPFRKLTGNFIHWRA